MPADSHHHLVPPRIVRHSQETGLGVDGAFDTLVSERGLAHVRHAGFPIERVDLDRLPIDELEVAMSIGSERHMSILASHTSYADAVIKLEISGGLARVFVAAMTHTVAEEVTSLLADQLRDTRQAPEDLRVPLHFWTSTPHGPQPMRRPIEVPSWSEIANNYPAHISAELDRAMHAGTGSVNGIALWQGEPGTGKTTALRALAHAWRDWCDIHVIVDPEVFLGEQASYLMNLLFSFEDMHHHPGIEIIGGYGDGEYDDDGLELTFGSNDVSYSTRVAASNMGSRAKLLVLEDAGELVAADARASSGQALSRLLNLTDGILGQGANISVLVTTNERVEDLHPAIARPGRCWSHIQFVPFSAEHAADWLEQHGTASRLDDGKSQATLAELYACLHGVDQKPFDELLP